MFSCPFVGAAGQELYKMLADAGRVPQPRTYLSPLLMKKLWLDSPFSLANVIPLRPTYNKFAEFCGPKAEGIPGLPAVIPGAYLRAEFAEYLDALREITTGFRYIIACGNVATWATLTQTKISKLRGKPVQVGSHTVFPVYHPAAVLRNWSLRVITVADLQNYRRGGRIARAVLVEPTLREIAEYYETLVASSDPLAFDIENPRGPITCISFAAKAGFALVIPFERRDGSSYWLTQGEEIQAWNWVRKLLDLPMPKVTQNGLYDIQHLWRRMGIPVRNATQDTMFLHHVLFPELQKDLDFLGSMYTDIGEWKSMRREGKKDG